MLTRIFLDGGAANVVQMYTVNRVGARFAHDWKICGLFLSFSACEHVFDVAHEKEGGRAKSKSIVSGTREAQSAFNEAVIVNYLTFREDCYVQETHLSNFFCRGALCGG